MIPLYQVDAFTHQPFKGNPAAVCLLKTPRPEAWMQAVSAEMNLSETAFLLPEKDGYRLRWFTPVVEVDLCGHATLASAHVLWQSGALREDETASFYTRSGLLTATRDGNWIELNFPTQRVEPVQAPPGLIECLGVTAPRFVGKGSFDFLIEVEDEEAVRRARPDFATLKSVARRGVILTSRGGNSGYDFISRFFAPQVGINEDPVTGSAHCCLAPYWGERLGKSQLSAYQASARGGELRLRLENQRVVIAGQAVTVLRGELLE